jgi:hypothetical protein
MPKRKRNAPPTPEVPMGVIAVFFVIALAVAFAKVGSGSSRSLADIPPQVRVA